ncbi:hypothetical protein V6R21_13675 [Limibacter armeniacum]|uniref:hypothetical protein n=1 Tax=Limibacter armeniacum TaxID=466084 RepID=UPI002FE57A39
MKTRLFILLLLVSSKVLGQAGFDPENYDSYFDLSNYLTDSENIQTKVDYSCAIFISPSDAQIEKMKNEYGEEDFYVVADDQNFYTYQANQLLDSLQVKVISIPSGRINLISAKQHLNWKLDTSKKGAPDWNLIIFNTNKPPKIISMVDITAEEIKAYFEIE